MAQGDFLGYIKKIKDRGADSHIYRNYQQTGLDIAELLDDLGHKALYIKLAKEKDPQILMRIAKDVAGRPGVKNKGAYFMRLLHGEKKKK